MDRETFLKANKIDSKITELKRGTGNLWQYANNPNISQIKLKIEAEKPISANIPEEILITKEDCREIYAKRMEKLKLLESEFEAL